MDGLSGSGSVASKAKGDENVVSKAKADGSYNIRNTRLY